MNTFGSSGDDGRRGEAYDRSRIGSGQYGGYGVNRSAYGVYGSRQYDGQSGSGRYSVHYGSGQFDGDRYGRSQYDGDRYGRSQYDGDRYGRSQYDGDRYGRSQYDGNRYGRSQYDVDHYGRNQYDGDRYGRSQYDSDRYGRSQSAGARYDQDRYSGDRFGRSQSRDFREYGDRRTQYRSPSGGNRYGREQYGGSLDRFDDSRRQRFSSGQYGDYSYGGDRYGRDAYGMERYGRGSGDEQRYGRQDYRNVGDRYGMSRDRFHSDSYGGGYGQQRGYGGYQGDLYQQRRIGYQGDSYQRGFGYRGDSFGNRYQRDSRSGFGYDRFGSSGRYGFDGDRPSYGSERYGYGSERYGYGSDRLGGRYASGGQDRYGYIGDRPGFGSDRYGRDQPGRVRFDSGRQDDRSGYQSGQYGQFRRGSFSEGQFTGRRDFDRRDDRFGRDQFLSGRPDDETNVRESQYRTEGWSNVNRRFEPSQPFRRGPTDRDSRSYEMQGGSRYQGGGQYGSQLGRDRMPPPIPPFSEPRSSYPTTLALTWNDDERCGQSSAGRSRELAVRATYDLMRRRYYEQAADPSQNPTWLQRGASGNAYSMANVSPDVLRVDSVDFQPKENSKDHRTFEYELVRDQEQPTPVFRRGQTFLMTLHFFEREYDAGRDNLYLNFYFGPNPSVPKRTRVVLPLSPGKEFQRVPYQWDARIQGQNACSITVEVNIPASSPVGMWRCVLETSTRDASSSRLQYRCPEDIYVIFNPFVSDDSVFMENDAQRYEYVMNDTGKVYTGGYRNVRGRPWIYGQYDDSVLPAACVLLEMSGLSHAERGNPVKVAKALTSMIKASRSGQRSNSFWEDTSSGLVEARYEDDYRGGNSPHLWTGSVQIIEEFLRGGAKPVKYAQCWVMAALMTTLCRTLGLPSRPVTTFVSALDTQDSLTVDRYVDKFGDVLEQGPGRDQPDSLWAFHVWCDVWMARPDQPQGYSGWQATDPCRTYRDYRDLFSGSCGPCPIEAMRRGDVGQRDDVDAFYASLNSYVRYFYEDDQSGWGYSPFRQFRFPLSRYILTKAVGKFDEDGDNRDLRGDTDCDDLTNVYRDNERSDVERFAVFNSCRGIRKDTPAFEYQAAAFNWGPFNPNDSDHSNFDVSFELDSPERVLIGEPVVIPVVVNNNSSEPRNIQTNICTRSSYYTGVCGPYLKRSSTQMTLAPNQQETITLTLDPWDYQDKLVDMSFVKITVTAFVQESGQSFIDEFDFRFNKPRLNIDVPEIRVGSENEATFSFSNPLDVPLTDCFLTMEISGSVRPRTIRIDREVRPRETFTYTQTFVPRSSGERRLVACFASRQLQDIVGQRPVIVRE